jgi:putative peptide zinc metalloprotease protein
MDNRNVCQLKLVLSTWIERNMLRRDSVIAVAPLTRQQEGDEVVIGNTEKGVFLAVPVEAAELLDQLAQGKSIGEVEESYRETYGQAPDLDDFLIALESKGLVELTGETNPGSAPALRQPRPNRRFHFGNFPQRLAQYVFSRTALAFCFLVIALALAAIHRDPWLASMPGDLFFPDHRALSWTILLICSYAGVFVHELAHLIAARALGINSRMGISHRLWYLVAEADLTGLWAVPKRSRYLPMLAGMLIDATSAASLILLLFAHHREWLAFSTLWVRMLRAMVFTYLMGIMWQFFLFVRTDLYYVIANFLNCRNLMGDTQVFLRNQLARIISSISAVDQSSIPTSERRVIRAYAGLWIAGRIWSLCLLLLVTVPVGVSYVRNLGAAFKTGYSANPSDFIDALVMAAVFLIPVVMGFILWTGALMRRERN